MPRTLPGPLARFLAKSTGLKEDARRVVLEQRGEMRLKPGAKWLTFTAEHWAAVGEVAFCWHARVKMAPFVTAVVEDAFEEGHGRLDAKIWGALPVAHGEGADFDRGEAQRYLAELPWNPGALRFNSALHYEERAESSVRVWHGEPETYVNLFLDDAGDVVRTFCDNRPHGDEGPRSWEGRFHAYAELDGLHVPTRGEVAWLLPDGEFSYWRGEIVSLRQE